MLSRGGQTENDDRIEREELPQLPVKPADVQDRACRFSTEKESWCDRVSVGMGL